MYVCMSDSTEIDCFITWFLSDKLDLYGQMPNHTMKADRDGQMNVEEA